MAIPLSLDDIHSHLACAPRLPKAGWFTDGTLQKVPEKTLHLYEFESCPYCRKVREAFSELDIDYISHPCGKGSNNRRDVIEHGGTAMFPYLVEPNADVAMYESEDIIDYIRQTYGSGSRGALRKAVAPLNTFASAVASGIRPIGGRAMPQHQDRVQPEHPLELWQFEMSPYCRKVREAMVALNLVYRVRNVAKRGRQRAKLVELGGKMQVPYLVDANTGTAMYESDEIVDYLRNTYG